MNPVTPQEWMSILKTAVESQNLGIENGMTHQYIVVKDNRYCTVNQTQTDPSNPKLSLSQIVEISVHKLKEVRKPISLMEILFCIR